MKKGILALVLVVMSVLAASTALAMPSEQGLENQRIHRPAQSLGKHGAWIDGGIVK